MSNQYVLPQAPRDFTQSEEMRFRDAVNKALRDLASDVQQAKNKTDRASSLATKRHQFLLMGAK